MLAAPRPGTSTRVYVAVAVLFLVGTVPALASLGSTARGAGAPGNVDLGDGFFATTTVQQVSASTYWDNFNCPSQAQFGWCVDPIGVAYLPSARMAVLSEGHCPFFCNTTRNALVEYYPVNGTFSSPLDLGCFPYAPYFPGTGNEYFVPCYNENGSTSILAVDDQTNTLVGNFLDPIDATTMTADSSNGLLVVGAGSTVVLLSPSTGAVESTIRVANATFTPDGFGVGGYTMVYDPLTDQLIVPSTGNALIRIDLVNGTVAGTVPLPALAESLAVDTATDQLLAATVSDDSTSGFSVFNAKTYSVEARMTLPNCIDYTCATPNQVNQILVDPLHGDAYLVGTLSLFTLNLSTLSLVGTTEDYGDGSQFSSAYIPSTDQIIYTYAVQEIEGPGLLVQLHHSTYPSLNSLLWLPPTFGALTAVQLGAAGFAIGWVRVRDGRHPGANAGPRNRFGRTGSG